MNTWKVILATLVIFGAGIVTGRLITGRVLDQKSGRSDPGVAVQSSPSGSEKHKVAAPLPGLLRKEFVDKLDKELQLTSEQKERIEKIILQGQEQARALWRGIEPEMHKTLVTTKEKICAELTPEQQAQFGQLLKQKQKPNPQRPPGDDRSTNAAAPASIEFAFDWSFCSFLNVKPTCQGTNASPSRCL